MIIVLIVLAIDKWNHVVTILLFHRKEVKTPKMQLFRKQDFPLLSENVAEKIFLMYEIDEIIVSGRI